MRCFMILVLFLAPIAGKAQEVTSAKVVFYRPKKFSAAASEFIIGSSRPDTVFVQLKNGRYHELGIQDFRTWDFVGGFFTLSARIQCRVEAGKTYYIKCQVAGGLPVKGSFELVPQETAVQDMADLKPMPAGKGS